MKFVQKLNKIAKQIVKALPPMAMAYRFIRDNAALLKQPRMTPLGFKFSGNPQMEQGVFEPEEVEIVRDMIGRIDVFINIGANIGYYCCMTLQAGVRTVAFEPIRANLRYLYRNINANHWEDVEIFPVALHNRSGLVDMYGGGTGASIIAGWAGSALNIKQTVPTIRLDDVLSRRFEGQRCFFLVDIEGAERFMLQGATIQLNLDPKPVWMVEITTHQHQPAGTSVNPHLMETFRMFWDNGYHSWTADKMMRPVTEKDIVNVLDGTKPSLGAHNFLFRAP